MPLEHVRLQVLVSRRFQQHLSPPTGIPDSLSFRSASIMQRFNPTTTLRNPGLGASTRRHAGFAVPLRILGHRPPCSPAITDFLNSGMNPARRRPPPPPSPSGIYTPSFPLTSNPARLPPPTRSPPSPPPPTSSPPLTCSPRTPTRPPPPPNCSPPTTTCSPPSPPPPTRPPPRLTPTHLPFPSPTEPEMVIPIPPHVCEERRCIVAVHAMSDPSQLEVCVGCDRRLIQLNLKHMAELANADVWIGGSILAVRSAYGDLAVLGKTYTIHEQSTIMSPLLRILIPSEPYPPLHELANLIPTLAEHNHDLVLVMRRSANQKVRILTRLWPNHDADIFG